MAIFLPNLFRSSAAGIVVPGGGGETSVSREWMALVQQELLVRRGSGHPWWSGRRKPLLAMVDDSWALATVV